MSAVNDNAAARGPAAAQTSVSGTAIEIWSGKDKTDENFPVGSFLIAKHLRPHVHAFYAFARNADDIADHDSLGPAEKIARLDLMEAVLTGASDADAPSAKRLKQSLARTGVPAIHARELLVAFRQDAAQNRYANWAGLMDYCRYSAAPVGRYVLDLHGESRETWPASDALCASLQVLNHLQDCGKDLRNLDRCYIPQDWLEHHKSGTDDIARAATSPGLRATFNSMLAATEALNQAAARLPAGVTSRRLRMETAIIQRLACRLTTRLQRHDPLAMRVKLRPADILIAMFAAASSLLPRIS